MGGKYLVLLFILTFHISHSENNQQQANGNHRIIKRFTPRFPHPPHMPPLQRPFMPFPLYPGHPPTGDSSFPKIRLRPPSDENLFTEEEDVPKKRKKPKPKPKPKATTTKKPTTFTPFTEASEEDALPTTKKKPKTTRRTKQKPSTKPIEKGESEEIPEALTPKPQADRTLITGSKAMLIKGLIAKKIIMKKLKKKGIIAGSKIKGVSVKTPGLQFSVGSPTITNAAAAAAAKEEEEDDVVHDDVMDEGENEKAGEGEGEDLDEEDDDDDDDDEDDTKAVELLTAAPRTTPRMRTTPRPVMIVMTPKPNMTTVKPQSYTSMMTKLQQHLQMKQNNSSVQQYNQMHQQQMLQPELPDQYQNYQNQNQMPEQYEGQGQVPQHYQQGQQAIVILPPGIPEIPVIYKGGSKASKKANKKAKKGKHKPRPVNLGVKANLYKKFSQLAKKTKSKLSSFIQIDLDYLARRGINEDKFMSRTLEVGEEGDGGEEPLMKSLEEKKWQSAYPRIDCGDHKPCNLRPVWVIIKRE